jgi:two-component sensor histidine kinase
VAYFELSNLGNFFILFHFILLLYVIKMKYIRFYIIFLGLIISIQSFYAQTYKDSLLVLIKTDKEDTNKVKHLLSLSSEYKTIGLSDSALLFVNKALQLSKSTKLGSKVGWKKGIANANNTLGQLNWKLGNYPEALNNYAIAQKLFKDINNKKGIANTYNNIALIYDEQGKYAIALKNYYMALVIMEEIKYKPGIAMAISNIGNSYYTLGNDSAAFKNHYLALKIKTELNDQSGIALAHNNIGLIFDRQGSYEESLGHYIKALNLFKKLNDQYHISMMTGNIAVIYYRQKKYTEAFEMYSSSLEIKEKIGDKEGIVFATTGLGEVCIETKKYKEAKQYLEKALRLSLAIGIGDDIRDAYKNLSIVDAALGNYKDALKNNQLYMAYKDSLMNEQTIEQSTQAAMQYDFDKKEATTKFEHDKKIVTLEAENKLQSQQRIFLILFIVVAIVLLVFAKRAYDNKKKIAEFMSSESHRKEVLLQEVHHRINNNLQIISSLLTLQANSAENEKLTEYLKQSQNRIQSLSVLHELLYQNDSPLQINMHDYLNKVLDFHRDVLNGASVKVDIKTSVDPAIFPTKLAVPLALIVNELVTNSIKYAFNAANNGQINISLLPIENEKNKWKLSVSDSGKGLPMDTNFRKDSLGLRLVTIMVKQIKGDLIKSNTPGATFEMFFVS